MKSTKIAAITATTENMKEETTMKTTETTTFELGEATYAMNPETNRYAKTEGGKTKRIGKAEYDEAKAKYNELMGMQCFEERKPLHEGVDLPNMICFGRGYGENSNPMDTSVISRFNNLVARNDPYTGQINPVLSRTQQFEYNNASKYKPDPNPELDKYVDTVFLGDMGPEAFTVNGENPYRVLDKIRAGEEVDLGPVAHGIAARPNLPDVVKETPSEEPDYVETFDSIFTPGN
jgi:hypothetical protein